MRYGEASNADPIPEIECTTRACSICADDKDPVEFPVKTVLPSSCSAHCQNTCQSCLVESISAAISNKPLSHIGCPVCDQAWDRDFVRVHAKAASLQVYYRREALALLGTLPEFRVCQSPICHSGHFHTSGAAEPIVTCNDCVFQSCFVHRMPWHDGRTCAEVDKPETVEERRARLARERKESLKDTGKGAKPCPPCRAPIFSTGGCNAMICGFSKPILMERFNIKLTC